MGNWHCVPSGCAEVVYKEYLPPSVRWKYPGEAWQEIIGANNYSVENIVPNFTGGQCEKEYHVYCKWDGQRKVGVYLLGKIVSIKCYVEPAAFHLNRYFKIEAKNDKNQTVTNHNIGGVPSSAASSEIVPALGIDDCGNKPSKCIFKVFKNGNIVHEETRSICPEVQQLPCRLSDVIKTIDIEKLPYLERVEVRNQSIEPIYLPPANVPLLDVKSLPSECLNIYNTYVLAPPFLSNYVPLPGIVNPYQYIAQICSSPGCLPPEYQVICDCECQSCPDGTHPIACGDAVCCYDSNGKSILEIPQSDYCGGDSCCE
jgi:hypothetical protein